MKLKHLALVMGIVAMGLFWACVKTATPAPPIHDTVTVHKTDTLIKTDTLHKTDTVLKPVDTPNLKNGLVLYLPFNGSFADSSGLGNTVTPMGGAALDYDMHGYAHSAFSATGNGERLVVTNNGSYKVDTAFSVSFDFMIRSNAYYGGGYDFSGLMVFLSIVNPANGNGPTFNLGLTLPGQPQYFDFVVTPSTTDCNSPGLDPATIIDTTNFVPQIGSWYNVICVFKMNTAWVYVNGKLVSTKTTTMSAAQFCPNSQFVIGGWWGSNQTLENLRGKLDEVRFYNRTLNAQQIAWLSRNFQTTSTRLHAVIQTR